MKGDRERRERGKGGREIKEGGRIMAYLAKEGNPEVGAEVPLPCSHNVYHLPEGSV